MSAASRYPVARTLVALLAGAAVAATLAAAAAGDGLPVLGIDVGSQGVATQATPGRYLTLPVGKDTMVVRTARQGGRVLGSLIVRGSFTIPAVAYDGSASGLAADGSRLVLIEPRVAFPRKETTLAVLDAKRLRLERIVRLRGDYSFDAISPRGDTMFLIRYTSATEPTRYQVRGFDLDTARLLPAAIVDPRERGKAMRGSPITRSLSENGRWAYTLYDGAGGTPFVHALDTSRRRARCIDLPMLHGYGKLSHVRFTSSVGGATLRLGVPGRTPLAEIDAADFRVSAPAAEATDTSRADRPWLVPVVVLMLLAGLAAAVGMRRRARGRMVRASVQS
jgi:hypothetical protein